ncbi:MAG: type IX secretion system membrane protein PorP/SprF [Bacteroidales bacterium]|nr:type IX secretion system membrane protein PorP/SprF [Bacteroidales bacterium]MDE6238016.1 type IX secretion system membrane protein PorP/SprF [Muribaculaceae bacterium]MDE6836221.1 type IX secretion system membrane protein PorP/SprF [Muribaculaceae bacterium]
MRKLSCKILIFFLTLFAFTAKGQNDVLLTQDWAVPTFYNPAATGNTDYLRIRGGTRLQWVGIENAPKSFLAAADMPVKIGKKRIGVGADFSDETLGLFSNSLINIQASYKLKFLKGTLSIGVQGGYYTSKFAGSKVVLPDGDDYHQPTDEAIPTRDVTGNTFDLSAGVLYTHKYFSIGISAQHLLDPTVRLGNEQGEESETALYETRLPRMLYLTADGNIPIKNTLFELQPSLLAAYDFKDYSLQGALRTRYKKFISFGVGYRFREAVSVMIGAEIKNFFVSYSYGYPLSALGKASSGTHEVLIGYQLKLDFSGVNKHKHRSIRLM